MQIDLLEEGGGGWGVREEVEEVGRLTHVDSTLIGYLEANVITATKQVIVTDYNDNRFY